MQQGLPQSQMERKKTKVWFVQGDGACYSLLAPWKNEELKLYCRKAECISLQSITLNTDSTNIRITCNQFINFIRILQSIHCSELYTAMYDKKFTPVTMNKSVLVTLLFTKICFLGGYALGIKFITCGYHNKL